LIAVSDNGYNIFFLNIEKVSKQGMRTTLFGNEEKFIKRLNIEKNRFYELKEKSKEYREIKDKNNKENVIVAVSVDGMKLKNASERLRDDKEVVLVAVANNENALEYASEKLQQDKDILIVAITKNKEAYKFLPDKLKQDKKFMKTIESIIK
jgi:NhaP-type Na+/H+ and K+/H+ antiporter